MKDLEEKDILNRTRQKLTRFSIYLEGRWRFGRLLSPTVIADNQSIFRMSVPFALVAANENNPRNASLLGRPGDYIASDNLGELSIITEAQYNLRFPKRRKQPYRPETSEKLKGGDFITKTVRESQTVRSNTTSGRRSSGGVLSPEQTLESQQEITYSEDAFIDSPGPGGGGFAPSPAKGDQDY
jgi:hypothetical protein